MAKNNNYQKEIEERIKKCISKERMQEGPIAVIECFERIPCNPCEGACPFNAIKIGEDITNLPILDEKKCKGCGLCIACCPGMAIFVVHLNYSQRESLFTFPYEFLPVPKIGSVVKGIDRNGKVVTHGRVIKVNESKKNNHTNIISIAIPKKFINSVRGIKIENHELSKGNRKDAE